MPTFDIIRKWTKPQSFRSQAISGTFTLTENEMSKRFIGTIPLEDEAWQIGVIVGRSGTGKTSIAKELWPQAYIKGARARTNQSSMIFHRSCQLQTSRRPSAVSASQARQTG